MGYFMMFTKSKKLWLRGLPKLQIIGLQKEIVKNFN